MKIFSAIATILKITQLQMDVIYAYLESFFGQKN